MNSVNEIIIRFRQKGHKITPQRRAIFETIFNNGGHPKADDIYKAVKGSMPDVSLTTIYNTLTELSDLGFIDVVQNVGDGALRYDPRTDTHDHLICLRCNRIIDIENEIDEVDIPENRSKGFQIVKKQVTYFGYCPECQKADGKKTG